MITVRIPHKTEEPYLYEFVKKHQMHKCTISCKKGRKRVCRYGYGKDGLPINTEKAYLSPLHKIMESRAKSRRRKHLYNPLRTKHERFVNVYNPLCGLVLESYMDIQS